MRRFPPAWLLGALGIAASLLAGGAAPADERAHAACEGTPGLAPAEPGTAPRVAVWSDNANWRPPSCTGWSAAGFRLLLAVTASFRSDENVDGLLTRFGAVSSLAGVRFWSDSDRAWKPLVEAAAALDAAGAVRPDFSAAEIRDGRPFSFLQSGGRAGDVVNRVRVVEARPDRLVVVSENATPIKLSLIQLFGPGDLQTLYVIERRSPGLWSYYSLTRVGRGASFLVGSHADSFVNRAVALYRHFAGLPPERSPPSQARS
jgi:hypothetical protein